MTQPVVEAESVLAIDISSAQTRALLFDVVDGQYRFVSAGEAPTTARAPFFHIGEGVQQAIQRLSELTARNFYDGTGRLILPSDLSGNGVDQLAITYSLGPSLRIVTAGLLEDISLRSINRLAASLPGQVLDSIGLTDRRHPEEQIDALLKAEPDLILIAGGIDGGANRSVARLAELIQFAVQILPSEKRPEIIYAGNPDLAARISETLSPYAPVSAAPNVRPAMEIENLGPAYEKASEVLTRIRSRQLGGLADMAKLATKDPIPTQYGFGRIIRFLSQIYDRAKGVFGLDLGSSTITMAAGRQGQLCLSMVPCGLGIGLTRALELTDINEVLQWLPGQHAAGDVRDYLYNKTLFPDSVPMTEESVMIEHAMARQLLRLGMQRLLSDWPQLTVSFEPILASGQVFAERASCWQSLQILLDGLQPIGITTLVLDAYDLTPALGSLAEINPLLPVQVIESSAYLNLGTVIAPICRAKPGTPILEVRVEYEHGEEARLEVKQGSLTVLPIRPEQAANVHLKALRPMQIDPLRGDQSHSYRIVGGACGAIIDTRGRPLVMPPDPEKRTALLQQWAAELR